MSSLLLIFSDLTLEVVDRVWLNLEAFAFELIVCDGIYHTNK